MARHPRMQQVLKASRKIDAHEFPQLAGVEVQLGKKRIDYTCYENQKAKEAKKDVAYEVKNWSSFGKGGLVVQIKGGVPSEAKPGLDLLKATAEKAKPKKIFRIEEI